MLLFALLAACAPHHGNSVHIEIPPDPPGPMTPFQAACAAIAPPRVAEPAASLPKELAAATHPCAGAATDLPVLSAAYDAAIFTIWTDNESSTTGTCLNGDALEARGNPMLQTFYSTTSVKNRATGAIETESESRGPERTCRQYTPLAVAAP